MWRENEPLVWSVLARAPALDASMLSSAIRVLGSASALIGAGSAAYDRAGIPAVARGFLTSRAAVPSPALCRWLEADGHHLVPVTDARYPCLLRSVPDCPVLLFVSGSPQVLADPQLAVVGSRNPSPQGSDTALAFAESLAARGLGITSGLAEGIDTLAHRGALQAQGITLGVLGNGIDLIYPRSNAALFAAIAQHGALVSEFPLGTPPRRVNFPQRNRIIAGLSLGTLVVEAARRSGSLITARLADGYGREVFAVPGSIYNPQSRGCHELIKNGARLVEKPLEILGGLNFSAFFPSDFGTSAGDWRTPSAASGMDKDHKILLDALGFDPVDLDGLVVRTGFKPEAVSSMMLILELEGHVQAAPGGRYSRVAYRRAGGER